MDKKYVIGIDQSTQGTKALLINHDGKLLNRADMAHKQIVNELGWVSHDAVEIFSNTIKVVELLLSKAQINPCEIAAVGISNQRETSVAWSRQTGEPYGDAIVWQCARAAEICERPYVQANAEYIRKTTGMSLSPYFPASKIAWIIENNDCAKRELTSGNLCHGTIDTWLIYKLTDGKSYKTDCSNASRTQLFDIHKLKWSKTICDIFGININNLPQVCDSNSNFGETTFAGIFDTPVAIHAVLGDSHGALFGQGCHEKGMTKATYGTGSSIMMNIGQTPILSEHGVVTSIAWGIDGKVDYVLEGNINYTGAVVTWLKDDVGLIESPSDTEVLCKSAKKDDELYLVPAFSGLGAPYWDNHATGTLRGITRTTGRAEIVRAGIECMAYQIMDVIDAMSKDANMKIAELRVDGGPCRNAYLMQFQSDIIDADIKVPKTEELSGIGVAYLAGIASSLFGDEIFGQHCSEKYSPLMTDDVRSKKVLGWLSAVKSVLKNDLT